MLGAVAIGNDDGETLRVTRISLAGFVWQVHEPHPAGMVTDSQWNVARLVFRVRRGRAVPTEAYGSPDTFRISISFLSRQRWRSAMLRPAASSVTPLMMAFCTSGVSRVWPRSSIQP